MRASLTVLAAIAATVLLPATPARAQSTATLAEGARIRVRAPSIREEPFQGTLVGIDADSLSLDLDGRHDREVVPRSAFTRVEVSAGRKRHTLVGALIGLGAGAALGGVAASTVNTETGELVAFCGGVGAAVGALIGTAITSERWEQVGSERLRVSLGPAPGGGVGVSLRVDLGRSR